MGTSYSVYEDDFGWAGKRDGSTRASVRADTQADAYRAARDLLARSGGGEISVRERNGQIRERTTVAPALDPRGTRG